MIKTYEAYLFKLFFKKIMNIFLLFIFLIITLSLFDEISFFKNTEVSLFYPILMATLNAPSIVFEIFPFIFLIATQFFYIELINKNELEFLKISGLNNLKIIKIIFFSSIILGTILVSIYYGLSSKLKFLYLELKNTHSNDNKYLAVVKESGLWIKDEINDKIYIINANRIENDYLINVSINEFDNTFNLIRIIDGEKVNVSKKEWIVINPTITKQNKILDLKKNIKINTHFDEEKINSMFENLSSLNIFQLSKLKSDYKLLGYSTTEVKSHLHKLFSLPIYLSIMSLLGSVTMLNIKRNKPMIYHLLLGIFLSVIIYYFYYLFNLLGENAKIPLLLSIYLPFIILTFVILIGLVRINEK